MADNSQLLFNLAGDSTLKVQLRGIWRLRGGRPSAALVEHELESARQVRDIAFDTRELTSWDSSVLTFLVEVSELCRQRRIPMNREGLPVGVQKLLALAEAVPERKGARREVTETSFLERVGTDTLGFVGSAKSEGVGADTFKKGGFCHFPARAFSFGHSFGESEKLLHSDGKSFAVHGN